MTTFASPDAPADSADVTESVESSPPQAVTPSVAVTTSSTERRTSVVVARVRLAIGHPLDDVEVLVELHVDLLATVERDLDLVVAVLVADLGLGDLAAARVRQRRGGGLGERVAGDRLLAFVVVHRAGGDGRADRGSGNQSDAGDGDDEGASFHASNLRLPG